MRLAQVAPQWPLFSKICNSSEEVELWIAPRGRAYLQRAPLTGLRQHTYASVSPPGLPSRPSALHPSKASKAAIGAPSKLPCTCPCIPELRRLFRPTPELRRPCDRRSIERRPLCTPYASCFPQPPQAWWWPCLVGFNTSYT